ncbi:MAG: hypothetical protein EA352_09185 [Gemmatimonadales bacterium]|nr:MAG: hypothetical protein EA352_09185 [Gemmatimonadales bacterium]
MNTQPTPPVHSPGSATSAPRARGGFTLVEVLVALLVLMVSVLALVQLQWGSLRASTDGTQVTLVQVQALDMAERVWLDVSDPLSQVSEWQEEHEASLPGWTGSVEADAADPRLVRIRIEWDGPSSSGATRHDHWVRVPGVAP